jgi:endoglucanase
VNPGHRILRVCALVLASALCVGLVSAPAEAATKRDVRLSRAFYVDPTTTAAQAARTDRRFAPIAGRAQALWLTDSYAVGQVRKVASDYAQRAHRRKKTPVLAIYAIPDRDCGQYSAGGFDARTYRRWIGRVAAGLKGKHAIAILEPDALALAGSAQCAAAGDRLGLLKHAARTLHAAGVWVYIDAGHSNWQPADVVASRLVTSGIKKYARGFSLNVSNYQTTRAERAYGDRVVSQLRKRGVKGKKYVVETARNGANNPPAGSDWCNPVGQRLGKPSERPRMVRKGNLDAFVWVKHPGESDGACNGGPNAGAWWPEGALRLLGKA